MRRTVLGLMLLLSMSSTTMGGYVYTYGGSATGVIVDLPVLPTITLASVSMPSSAGGQDSVNVVDADVPLLASVGVLDSSISGGIPVVGVTNAASSLETISLLGGLVTVTSINSNASAFLNGVSGSSSIAQLMIGNDLATVTGALGETFNVDVLGLTVATLVLNEQVSSVGPDGSMMTVNALRLTVLDTILFDPAEVILSQSVAQVGYTAVPEPSSFALVVAAFSIGGGIKLVRHRRKITIA